MMMEYQSNGVKTSERKDLPAGVYRFADDGTAIKIADYVDDVERAYDAAADKMRAALERLK